MLICPMFAPTPSTSLGNILSEATGRISGTFSGEAIRFSSRLSRYRQTLANFWIAGDTHQLVELVGRGQQIEPALTPKHDEMCRKRYARK
jgi:hypothetical protein